MTGLPGRAKERCDRRPSGDWERATCCLAKALLNLHKMHLVKWGTPKAWQAQQDGTCATS